MYGLINALLRPYTFCFVAAAGAMTLLWRRRVEPRRRLLFVALPFAVLWTISLPVVALVVRGTLRAPYVRLERRPPDAQALVVLSGDIILRDVDRAVLGESSYGRCLHAAEVYRVGPPCPVLVTGGKVDPASPGPPAAAVMAEFLRTMGVADSDLIVEARAGSTYENAVESARELKRRGIGKVVLITEGTHMLRSVLCFRRQGVEVVPSASDAGTVPYAFSVIDLLPSPSAARDCQTVFHEWLGLTYYRLTGKI